MSSEISIEERGVSRRPSSRAARLQVPPSTGANGGSSDVAPPSDAFQPWQLFTLAGLIGATLVVFLSRGHTPAGVVLLSLTIFAAAGIGLAAWRTFAPLAGQLTRTTSGQVLAGRTRAALEREKTLVLRSIKELEFDRAMGKLSERDFAEMSARLRVRAAGLLQQLDAGSTYREQIEVEVERRLGRTVPDQRSAPNQQTVANQQRVALAAAATIRCPHCGTDNDADARFCKRCGASLEPSE